MHQLRYKIGKRAKEKRAEVEARQRETRRSGSAPKRYAPNWNRVKMEVAEVKRAKLTRVKAERANVEWHLNVFFYCWGEFPVFISIFQSPPLDLLFSPPWFDSLFGLYTDIHRKDSVLCTYTLPRYHFTVLYLADVVAPDQYVVNHWPSPSTLIGDDMFHFLLEEGVNYPQIILACAKISRPYIPFTINIMFI